MVTKKSGFDLTTRDSYFTILVEFFKNHILAKSTYFMIHREWPEQKVTVSKPANKYQIVRQCHSFKSILIDDDQHHSFFIELKFLQSWKWQITKTRWFTLQIYIFYLICLGARKVFRKIMQKLFFNETSRYITIHSPQTSALSAPYFFALDWIL